MALPLGFNRTFGASTQYEQLVRAQFKQGPLPMPHAAGLRGLRSEVRTLRQARLETSLTRAEHHNA